MTTGQNAILLYWNQIREEHMKIIVSACLLGKRCKYNGGDNYRQEVVDFCRGKEVIPVCPEIEAGMPCPRPPVEIVDGKVTDCHGKDVDKKYRKGVEKVLKEIGDTPVALAVLKSRSPTCGVHEIYDGTFTGRKIKGSGILAEALRNKGIPVIDEEDALFNKK